MKAKGSKILLIIVAVVAVLLIAKNVIIKVTTEQSVKMVTGLPLKIGSFQVGVFKPRIIIKDLQLENPAGYQDRVMVDIPEVYIDYRPLALLGGKLHLAEMRFHLREFVVVKNQDGTTNLDALKALQKPSEEKPKEEGKPGKAPQLQVDNLSLKVEKVIFKDYKDPTNPKVKEFNINIDEKHQNISSLAAVVSVIVFKTLTKTTIASLTNFDVSGLGDTLSGTLKGTTEAAGAIVGSTSEKTKEAIDSTTENIKGLFKFGDK